MSVTYYKRYRMELDLRDLKIPKLELPRGYRYVPWSPDLLEAHAESKHQSFREELDAEVFPCLGHYAGCLRLMDEISQKSGFLSDATWLVVHHPIRGDKWIACGTVQGIAAQASLGAIQNLGITPEHRGLGLGTALMYRALRGFQKSAMQNVYLEVTAKNRGAVRLYARMGFKTTRTVYKAVEVAYS